MTESLQSFLKGNFENDAALGLSCTETTRNTAANALYGKSFKDLSEAEKQLTLLQMVEDANKASGAYSCHKKLRNRLLLSLTGLQYPRLLLLPCR